MRLTDGIHHSVEGNHPNAAAPVAHALYGRPLIGCRAVHLRRVQTLLPVEATAYEHLACEIRLDIETGSSCWCKQEFSEIIATSGGAGGRVTPLVYHGRNQTPLVDGGLVALGRVLAHMTIKATHCVNVASQHGDADVTAPCVHGRDLAPSALHRIVTATRVEVVHAVEAADDVHLVVDGGAPVVGARAHVGALQLNPAIRPRVVRLNDVRRTAPAPTADRENHLQQRYEADTTRRDAQLAPKTATDMCDASLSV